MLDYMLARYYGASLGRFLSVDPIGVSEERQGDPKSLNLYIYANLNPIAYTDPTGADAYGGVCRNDAGENYGKIKPTTYPPERAFQLGMGYAIAGIPAFLIGGPGGLVPAAVGGTTSAADSYFSGAPIDEAVNSTGKSALVGLTIGGKAKGAIGGLFAAVFGYGASSDDPNARHAATSGLSGAAAGKLGAKIQGWKGVLASAVIQLIGESLAIAGDTVDDSDSSGQQSGQQGGRRARSTDDPYEMEQQMFGRRPEDN
jgi:RHS repeat-associated protein